MIHAFGFALAGMAGMSLGLIGGGGSLLTVPILVYGFQLSTIMGSSYSLAIVGTTTLVGTIAALGKRQVHFPTALIFLVTSLPGAYLTRRFILHALPETLWQGSKYAAPRETLLMGAFGILMILAALLTAANLKPGSGSFPVRPNHPILLGAMGFSVGALSGLFGAGGGFLIVPALVMLARLPIPVAVGTSMAIVSANSWIGLTGDLGRRLDWNWDFVLLFTSFSLAGMLLGRAIGAKLEVNTLKTVSVWTMFIVGLFIFLREISQGVPWS